MPSRLISATLLLLALLAPRAASATQGAELYRTQAHFYGRFEARLRFAPGEGVVSSFFLWKEGSSSTTSWNELDFEKINGTCRMQSNIWTAKGTQSAVVTTPAMDLCAGYHTYAFEWTPDYIAWFIDGTQLRKVTGASVTEYTQNASQGMTIHFNLWAGNSSFGGVLNAATLPVYQFISWVQYSSYTNGAFQQQWREDFTADGLPAGWGAGTWASPNNLSMHNAANVRIVNGIAVLAMTADNATGYTGTPPADGSSTGGASGTGGAGAGTGGATGTGGGTGIGGAVGATGGRGAGGTGGASATGGSAFGSGGGGGPSTGTGGNSGTGGAASTGAVSGSGGSGVATGTGGANSGTGGSNNGTPGSGGGSATGGAGGAGETGKSDAGCGCRTAGDSPTGAAGLIALLLLGGGRMRRLRGVRRRHP